MDVRTPEEYWETFARALPSIIPAVDVRVFRRIFISGMSAMVSLMAELRDSSMPKSEKQATYRAFVRYIHLHDAVAPESRGSVKERSDD